MNGDSPRVAILGGTGFAGRNIRNLLERSRITNAVFSRTTGCDLSDLAQSWAQIDRFKPDFMINCAAHVGSVNYVSDFAADVVDANMRIILNVYKIAQQMREVVVVNPIANCAYPGIMDLYDEKALWDGPLHPSVLSYGSTRRMIVVASRCYADQYGVRSVNLLVPNMYGPFDSTNPNKTHALNALVIKFVRAVKYDQPQVEVWGTGKPIREWLYVGDLAAIMQRVVTSPPGPQDPVNIGQRQGFSVTEIVDTLKEAVGYKGEIVYNPRYPDGSPKKVMEDHYFRQRFPDVAFTPLDRGIAETVAYYQAIL